jgi:hypothetical protein
MTIALCILVWQRQKKWIYRLLGAAPLCIHLVFGRFCEWFFEERQQIVFLSGHMHRTGVVTEMNYFNIQHYIPLMILFAAGISLMIAIYLAFGNSFKSVMAIAILFAGVGARMIVAFSSTVWASLNRTYTIFYFTLIGLTLMFANEIKTEKLKPLYYLLYAGLFYLAVTNVMAVYAVL